MISRYFLHYDNPHKKDVSEIAKQLKKGHIAIIPTDTIYALACLWTNKKGIDRILKILGKKEKHLKLSLICKDIRMASEYAMPISNKIFRTINNLVPGPYTFIMESNITVQRVFRSSKKEIGIRIPDDNILQALISELGEPLVTSSLNKEDEITPYYNDPIEMLEFFNHSVDIFIDGGIRKIEESTILDCQGNEITLIRQGKGSLEGLFE
jgi:tRNA threonylcarbamoyl adenosine modification protein (Sua5/YciO/YrdC/YwlC family)